MDFFGLGATGDAAGAPPFCSKKRSFERKVEKLIEKGSIKDSESAIKKFLMSEAKRYATEKMKKDYEDNPDELGVVKD